MSADNNPVQPTPFQANAPTPSPDEQIATSASPGGTPSWVLPALGGLLLLAAVGPGELSIDKK